MKRRGRPRVAWNTRSLPSLPAERCQYCALEAWVYLSIYRVVAFLASPTDDPRAIERQAADVACDNSSPPGFHTLPTANGPLSEHFHHTDGFAYPPSLAADRHAAIVALLARGQRQTPTQKLARRACRDGDLEARGIPTLVYWRSAVRCRLRAHSSEWR